MVLVHHAASIVGPGRTGRVQTLAQVFDSGVAVFFVMSGFLLWRPIVAASLAGRPVVRPLAFWWRRILRIVPAYWVALTVLWAVGSFHLGSQWWRYYLFLQIYRVDTVLGGIVPAWSLCTEMSFYLVLPLLGLAVAAVVCRAPQRWAGALHLAACAVLWCGGFVARYVVDHHFPAERGLAFEWLPQNLDLFATGMALAAVSAIAARNGGLRHLLDRATAFAEPWWAAGLALFLWYAYRVGPTSFEVGYTGWFWHQRQLVLGIVTALLLVPVVFGPQDRGPLRRVWGLRPLVWVGTVSYGLYLWHLDLMELAVDHGWFAVDGVGLARTSVWTMSAFGLAVGLVAAAISWYGIERPLQRFRNLIGSGPMSVSGHAGR
jgi:peptidoglycan/LPS O-acetylase OafA/YrhL